MRFNKVKNKKVAIPFHFYCSDIFLIKYAAAIFVKLDHPVKVESVYALLSNPLNSYMPLLWFIHALFLIFIIYPLLRLYIDNYLLFVFFIIINSIIGNDFLVFGNSLRNISFFIFGVILRENSALTKKLNGATFYHILITLFLFITFYYMQKFSYIPKYCGYSMEILIGILGAMLVIDVSHAILKFSNSKTKNVIWKIGYYSMTIYLFHTLFESTVRIGFFQILKNIDVPFELIAFLAVSCGIIFPVIIEKKIFRRFRITKKFILGIS